LVNKRLIQEFAMRLVGFVLAFGLLLPFSTSYSADMTGLSWGNFVAADNNEAEVTADASGSSARELAVTLQLNGFAANADAAKTEASATFSGQFLVTQPKHADLNTMRITVGGLIIKTSGTTARVDITVGSATVRQDWATDVVRSERYVAVFNSAIVGGRLPSPLPVNLNGFVQRGGEGGAVLVTVDSVKLEITPTLVSDYRYRGQKRTKPTERLALPAVVVANMTASDQTVIGLKD
jgi:hypothetical protein